MKEKYEDYGAYNGAYYVTEAAEKLDDIKDVLEEMCELLEKCLCKLVEGEKERKEAKEEKKEEAAKFKPVKIGADIGGEKNQMDIIARIFGNK